MEVGSKYNYFSFTAPDTGLLSAFQSQSEAEYQFLDLTAFGVMIRSAMSQLAVRVKYVYLVLLLAVFS